VRKRADFHSEKRLKKCKKKELGVVDVRWVQMPDADSRLSSAIDLLLRSVSREPEGDPAARKGEEPPRDSRPKGVPGQSDGEEG